MKKKTTVQVLDGLRKKWLNKYLLAFLIFVSWLLFFDKYNFFAQAKLKRSTAKLEQEYNSIRENIEIAKKEQIELERNQEKYGREKYYLHKDNEDVFIIEKNDKKK